MTVLLAEAAEGERRAIATLLVLYELAASDHAFAAVERETIVEVMDAMFGLQEQRVTELLVEAEQVCRSQRDLHALTLAIRKGIPEAARRRDVVKAMWTVVLADGDVEHLEEMLTNSVSSLLGVSFAEVARIRKEIGEA